MLLRYVPKRPHAALPGRRLRLQAKLAQDKPEHHAIVTASLAGDAEVEEEDDCASGREPTVELIRGHGLGIRTPDDGRDMLHASEVEVRIIPVTPWSKRLRSDVKVDTIARDGDEKHERGRG